MKKIIGLSGVGGTGKTETLNLLIDLLEVATTGCSMPTPQPESKDRKKIFTYNGNIVGIGTSGDSRVCVQKNCDFFDNNKCDIAISATRSWGGSCDCLNEFADKYKIKAIWISKNITSQNQAQANLVQAQALFNLL